MADQDNDSKTEAPTGKRLTEAMEQGQFARSQNPVGVRSERSICRHLLQCWRCRTRELMDLAINVFTQLGHIRLQLDTVPSTINDILLLGGRVLAPLLVATIISAVLAGGLQSGFQLTPKVMSFKFERLDPIAGFFPDLQSVDVCECRN